MIKVKLNTINDVKDFVNIVSEFDFDMNLYSGRYIIDPKSIMGVLSLSLDKPLDLEILERNEGEAEPLVNSLSQRGLLFA